MLASRKKIGMLFPQTDARALSVSRCSSQATLHRFKGILLAFCLRLLLARRFKHEQDQGKTKEKKEQGKGDVRIPFLATIGVG